MNTIVGYEKERKEIEVLKQMLLNFESYKKNGVRIPRGILLCGMPGVGKTVLAQSLAGDGINIVELRASLCCNDEVQNSVQEVFERAKKNAPSVLLLDELDKIAGVNDFFFMETNDKVRKTLLAELDALSLSDKVLVVATCNDEDAMGDALIRPGRFDRILKISLPDEETRKNILELYFERIKVEKQFDISALARSTRGFSGAKLECFANEAGIIALQKNNHIITEDDIRVLMNKMEFSALEANPFKDYKYLHRVAVHEAGHTLVGMLLCPENVFGTSILPQGESSGHVNFISDSTIKTVSEIEDEIAIMLAGHVAERCEFDDYLVGSSSDIQHSASRLHYLFTKEPVYGYKYILDGLGGESLSEASKSQLENEINTKLQEIDERVESLISNNYSIYKKILSALEEKFVLSREDLNELVGSCDIACSA